MQWYLWRVRTVVCSICVRVGVLVPLTPVMPVARRGIRKRQSWQIRWLCSSQKLHGLKLEIESRAPGRQAGGPAVLASLAIEPEWLAQVHQG